MNIKNIKVGMLQTNCYVISNPKSCCWIIDPGNESKKIINYLETNSLAPKKILLTHGHFDHVEAVSSLKQAYPQLLVYVHSLDIPFLRNNYVWENYLGRPLIDAPYDEKIEHGDIIKDEDFEARVIFTPGHSPGSVCYLIENKLFSGDTVFADGGIGRTDLWQSSSIDMRNSLKRVFSLEKVVDIYPGHGRATTMKYELSIRRMSV